MRSITITLGFVLCLTSPVCLLDSSPGGKTIVVTVAAGLHDRRDTVVAFSLPNEISGKGYVLREESGRSVPLQVEADHRATFVLAELKSGATKQYRIEQLRSKRANAKDIFQLVELGDKLTISFANRRVLTYQEKAGDLPSSDIRQTFTRGGYLHPVYTPSGRVITDDYPADHRHHHGIWFAWTKTEFEGRHPDFWNMGDATGRVDFVALDEKWNGPVCAGFKARHRFVDLTGSLSNPVLEEEWTVAAYRVGQGAKPYTMFDLLSAHSCSTSSRLILPEYRYGGVGFRGHRQWLPKDNCFFMSSEGRDRTNGNGTRARWCHIGGRIDGQLAGIAVLDHPSNFRAPQPMRINPDQPFFCYAPSQMGQWQIDPGKPYLSRYRFVVYDGLPDKAELDRLWDDYANPPQVTVNVR